jgi:hypothetical protein
LAERLKNGLVAATFFASAQWACKAAVMDCAVSLVGVQNPASALVVTLSLLPFFSCLYWWSARKTPEFRKKPSPDGDSRAFKSAAPT